MEQNHLKSFEVSGFKKFTDLKIDNIGQFKLIIGDNNVGKTSLLEALLIDYDLAKSMSTLATIIYHVRRFTQLNDFFLSYFFADNASSLPQQILIKQIEEDGNFNVINYEKNGKNGYTVIAGRNKDISSYNASEKINYDSSYEKQEFNFNTPFIPFGSLYNHELTKLYSDSVQLFVDKKEKLVVSLSHIIKGIKNIEVNASYASNPILLISETGKNKLSPLAAYGDGAIKLFRILLSLFSNDHYNRLMIDELDAGVHYSRLTNFTKSLLNIANEQGKQIFATTHSKECIESFTKALEETGLQNEGRIIRLAETKHGIKAYTMEFAEFENSLLAESEIR